MPDEARELQTIRPASHTTALGELFIAEIWAEVQEGILCGSMFINLVRAKPGWSRGDAGLAALDWTPRLRSGQTRKAPSLRNLFELRSNGQPRAGCPHIEAFLSTTSYGNSRVTHLAGLGLVLVMWSEYPPGSHLYSPELKWAGMRRGPSMLLRMSRSLTATSKCGPWC
jgi:hypothetical protein